MFSRKKLVPAVVGWTILAVIIVICLGLVGSERADYTRMSLAEQVKLGYQNYMDSLFWSRRAPMTTVVLEEELKRYLPDPFASFTREDWDWFWHLLYGRFPDETSKGWPKPTRQLSKDKVEDELVYYYEEPFARFGEKQWSIFWLHMLKGKVFK